MNEIILLGAGGHARSCIDVIEEEKIYKIAGLIVQSDKYQKKSLLNYPIIGTDDELSYQRKKYKNAFISVGQIYSSDTRKKLFNKLKKLDFVVPTIFSPLSHISSHANIGKGTILMHNTIVNSNAKIGNNCIINNKALIEHDAIIGDNCHIATGAIVNGNVSIGDNSFIGSGVITKNNISIGSNCLIGAGMIIKSNIKDNQTIK